MSYDPRNPGPHNLSPTAYDPNKLVIDVRTLLMDRGLTPDISAWRSAETAACVLLRALGISPATAPEDHLDLTGGAGYNARVHGD